MTFWELFIALMIFVPLIMLWVFALTDLFQRMDLTGAAKALWAITIVLLPVIGMLIYFSLRDSQLSGPDAADTGELPTPSATVAPPSDASNRGAADVADQLERLADLRDKSILTDEEFQREKDRLLGPGTL